MVNISKMNLEDLNSIQNILTSEFDSLWTINILKSELTNSTREYIVAKIDNEIVGFAGIFKNIDDIHIMNIVTKKNYRNQGIASLMLKNLINMAKNLDYTEITLEVNANNYPAINIYKKFNFKTLGIRKKYYDNTDDAIIMTLYL